MFHFQIDLIGERDELPYDCGNALAMSEVPADTFFFV